MLKNGEKGMMLQKGGAIGRRKRGRKNERERHKKENS